jgi:hypothetical protein
MAQKFPDTEQPKLNIGRDHRQSVLGQSIVGSGSGKIRRARSEGVDSALLIRTQAALDLELLSHGKEIVDFRFSCSLLTRALNELRDRNRVLRTDLKLGRTPHDPPAESRDPRK